MLLPRLRQASAQPVTKYHFRFKPSSQKENAIMAKKTAKAAPKAAPKKVVKKAAPKKAVKKVAPAKAAPSAGRSPAPTGPAGLVRR